MNAESTVLVAVLKEQEDLLFAQRDHWYRIPQKQAPQGIHVDIIALFMGRRFFPERDAKGGIYYYAQPTDVELVRRRDLLPHQPQHKNADELYYKIKLTELKGKKPPILNDPIYMVSFIYTNWDHFQAATIIQDLYNPATRLVEKVYRNLQKNGCRPQRIWEHLAKAKIRVICENGEVVASTNLVTETTREFVYLNPADYLAYGEKSTTFYTEQITETVQRLGGPKMLDIPVELI